MAVEDRQLLKTYAAGIVVHSARYFINKMFIFLFKMIQDSIAESAIVWWRSSGIGVRLCRKCLFVCLFVSYPFQNRLYSRKLRYGNVENHSDSDIVKE